MPSSHISPVSHENVVPAPSPSLSTQTPVADADESTVPSQILGALPSAPPAAHSQTTSSPLIVVPLVLPESYVVKLQYVPSTCQK